MRVTENIKTSGNGSEKGKIVLRRDNNRCRNYGSRERLVIHHRQYHRNKYKEKPVDYAYFLSYVYPYISDN